MENRLLRNEHDKVIAGVSSGLASYMQVDVTIIRLLFVLSTIFLVGTGVLVYLVMWIVVPVNNDPAARFSKFTKPPFGQPPFGTNPFSQPNPFNQPNSSDQPDPAAGENAETRTNIAADWQTPDNFKTLPKNSDTGRTVGGLFLLVIGLYFLMNEFDIIPYWFRLSKLWPLVFVAIGLSFILKSKRKNNWEEWKTRQNEGTTYTEQKTADFSQDLPKEEPGTGIPKDQL
jgi:phage shock protein C